MSSIVQDEKARLQAAEAQPLVSEKCDSPPPPPAYTATTTVHISASALEALSAPPQLPPRIRHLPVTLPLTHVAISVPVALYAANSLPEAVFYVGLTSFVLILATTKSVLRQTRDDPVLRALAARRLVLGTFLTLLWPLVMMVALAPAHHRRCMMRHMHMPGKHYRGHHIKGERPHRPHGHHRHHHEAIEDVPVIMVDELPPSEPFTIDNVIITSKGARPVLSVPEPMHHVLPHDGGRFVVTSSGIKMLAEGETMQVGPEA